MSRIKTVFAQLQQRGRKALIPYITAGDPDPGTTVPLMHAMVAAGAELIANFKPVLLVFAGILVYSAVKLAFVEDREEDEGDLSDNGVVKLCR